MSCGENPDSLLSRVRWAIRCAYSQKRRRVLNLFRPKRKLLRQVEWRATPLLVIANEDVGWCLMRDHRFEEGPLRKLEDLIEPTDVCVDVGANIGIYTVFMAKRAIRGKVIAFEPQPVPRHVASLNVWLNGLQNVELREEVLSDKVGTVHFYESSDSGYSSMRPVGRRPNAACRPARASTLDDLFAARGQCVDILKIDAEGAELAVLKGARQTLSQGGLRPRAIQVECSPVNQVCYGNEPIAVFEFLGSLGYEGSVLLHGKLVAGCSERRDSDEVLFVHRDPRPPRASVS